jgi:hypothetical protein
MMRRKKMMTDEMVMREIFALLALTRDVLRDIILEEEIDNGLLRIYLDVLIKQGLILDELAVDLATYLGSYLDYEIGREGTD